MTDFDLAAFTTAFERRDTAAWLAFYADDAEWVELRAGEPPSPAHVLRGREAIAEHLRRVAAHELELSAGKAVQGRRRAAFTATIVRPDGRRIVQNVMLELRDGLIVRQVDVEALEP